jgi:hypothetical protein
MCGAPEMSCPSSGTIECVTDDECGDYECGGAVGCYTAEVAAAKPEYFWADPCPDPPRVWPTTGSKYTKYTWTNFFESKIIPDADGIIYGLKFQPFDFTAGKTKSRLSGHWGLSDMELGEGYDYADGTYTTGDCQEVQGSDPFPATTPLKCLPECPDPFALQVLYTSLTGLPFTTQPDSGRYNGGFVVPPTIFAALQPGCENLYAMSSECACLEDTEIPDSECVTSKIAVFSDIDPWVDVTVDIDEEEGITTYYDLEVLEHTLFTQWEEYNFCVQDWLATLDAAYSNAVVDLPLSMGIMFTFTYLHSAYGTYPLCVSRNSETNQVQSYPLDFNMYATDATEDTPYFGGRAEAIPDGCSNGAEIRAWCKEFDPYWAMCAKEHNYCAEEGKPNCVPGCPVIDSTQHAALCPLESGGFPGGVGWNTVAFYCYQWDAPMDRQIGGMYMFESQYECLSFITENCPTFFCDKTLGELLENRYVEPQGDNADDLLDVDLMAVCVAAAEAAEAAAKRGEAEDLKMPAKDMRMPVKG